MLSSHVVVPCCRPMFSSQCLNSYFKSLMIFVIKSWLIQEGISFAKSWLIQEGILAKISDFKNEKKWKKLTRQKCTEKWVLQRSSTVNEKILRHLTFCNWFSSWVNFLRSYIKSFIFWILIPSWFSHDLSEIFKIKRVKWNMFYRSKINTYCFIECCIWGIRQPILTRLVGQRLFYRWVLYPNFWKCLKQLWHGWIASTLPRRRLHLQSHFQHLMLKLLDITKSLSKTSLMKRWSSSLIKRTSGVGLCLVLIIVVLYFTDNFQIGESREVLCWK